MANNHAQEIGSLQEASRSSKKDINKLFKADEKRQEHYTDILLKINDIPHIVDATDRMAVSMEKIQKGIDKLQSGQDALTKRVAVLEDGRFNAKTFWTGVSNIFKSKMVWVFLIIVALMFGDYLNLDVVDSIVEKW